MPGLCLYRGSLYCTVLHGGERRIIICPPPLAIPNKLAGNMKRQRVVLEDDSVHSARRYILLVDERQSGLWVATILTGTEDLRSGNL